MNRKSKLWLPLAFVAILAGCQKKEVTDNSLNVSLPALKATSATFTVLSYNVAGLPQILSSAPNRELYTPIIGQKTTGYDIVNVQEDFNYHAALYSNDTHPYRTATSGGAGIGSGLNTMSNFPFSDDIDRVTWNTRNSSDGNSLTPKGFTWLRVRLAEGVYVDVYNIHTCAGDGTESLAARQDNISQIISYIQTNSAGNAVLIFGDTNCRYTRTGDNIRSIVNTLGMTDPWVKLIKGGVAPALGADALVCDDLTYVLTSFGCEVVDKIFYRGNNFVNLSALTYTLEDAVFRYTDGSALSDHRPAYTKFQYTLATNMKLSDQFGGPHGTSYSDVNKIPSNPKVSIIGIRTGTRVDQVNIMLSDKTWFTHGGYGGTYTYLTLNSGEYVKSVYICSGVKDGHTRVFYTKFTTSSGRTLAGGSTTSTSVTYTAPSGWQIVGFHGRSGDELDKMGVIYAPVN
jgi:hypothetical protein